MVLVSVVSFFFCLVFLPKAAAADSFDLSILFFYVRFLVGFFFPFAWYLATFLYLTSYYRRDPRERSGLAASAIAVSLSRTHTSFLDQLAVIKSIANKTVRFFYSQALIFTVALVITVLVLVFSAR